MYLYITDNRDSDDIAVTRLLTLGKDYTLNGSKIQLITIPVAFTDSKMVSVRAYYYEMDSDSNVPASMTKLGLSHTYVPQVVSNELDNAKRFYYQRKTCFRGMMRYNKKGKFNIPFGKYKTINYNDLKNKRYEELLKKTKIFNKSFEYVFEKYNDKNNFMFLDPPYDSEFTDYGYCKFGKEEQIILANLFKQTKIRCLMIIGKTKFIEDLYKDYIVSEYDKKYKFKIHSGRVGDEINTKHLIIKNYK
jgi:DNA adenine methylase Dam